MTKYIVQNKDNGYYFEMDFAGFSWQEEFRLAYKFNTVQDAQMCTNWLEMGNLEIVEI